MSSSNIIWLSLGDSEFKILSGWYGRQADRMNDV